VARSRAASEYVCQTCAASFPKWEGQCRACGAWNALVETLISPADRRPGARARSSLPAAAEPLSLGSLGASRVERRPTGIGEVDRLLGGGFVPGSVLLLGGEPGIGKSTLVLQLAGALAASGSADADESSVLYASAEESASQLHLRAERLGLIGGPADGALSVLAGTEVTAIVSAASARPPALLVVDSIQTVQVDGLDGPPGSVGQVRESAVQLGAFAREHGVPVLLVGHVTKDGALAGPRTLEHLVDAVLMLEGDRYGSLRLLRALKNRHGSTEEIVAAILEGSRPLLVEVQALVAPATGMGPPRRTVAGLDTNRLALLIAVLARRGGIDVSGRDVYASLAGGLTESEPALDLPLALAIAASQRDQALPADTLVCGEVSLLGEVRSVPGLDRRLREAGRLGFRRALVPEGPPGSSGTPLPEGIEIVRVATLREALDVAFRGASGTSG